MSDPCRRPTSCGTWCSSCECPNYCRRTLTRSCATPRSRTRCGPRCASATPTRRSRRRCCFPFWSWTLPSSAASSWSTRLTRPTCQGPARSSSAAARAAAPALSPWPEGAKLSANCSQITTNCCPSGSCSSAPRAGTIGE